MARFGNNEFVGFSVPFIFDGRYFILESQDEPVVTVLVERDGKPVFEILKNKPMTNDITNVTANAGIITVSDKITQNLLYKVRPDNETSVVFCPKIDSGEILASISHKGIKVAGITVDNNYFDGNMAGVMVNQDGNVHIGAIIPPIVLEWLKSN